MVSIPLLVHHPSSSLYKQHSLILTHKPQLLLDEDEEWRDLLIPNQDFSLLPIGLFDGSGSLEDYEEVDQLDVESRNAIFKGRRKDDGQEVVLKPYHLSNSSDRKHLSRQVSLIHKLEHPQLIKIQSVFIDRSVYIEFPFYENGSVEEWMSNNPHLSMDEKKSIIADLLLGVSHLHSNGIVHCDIKLGNIFVDGGGRGVLGDFDGSREVGSRMFSTTLLPAQVTIDYLAPELREALNRREEMNITIQCDMYSVGVCVELLLDDEGRGLSDEMKKENPLERMDIQQALTHPLMKEYVKRNLTSSIIPSHIPPVYWSTMRCDGMSLRMIDILDSPYFDLVNNFMMRNWEASKIGVGRDGKGLNHNSFRIVGLWRVENTLLWRRYASRTSDIISERSVLFPQEGDKFVDSCCIDQSRNELMLFHGAGYNVVDIICNQGFDERLGSLGGFFGSGVYFACRSSKSDEYVRQPSPSNTYKMIISRVCMGNYYTTQESMNNIRRPPCIEGHIDPCSHLRHDSVYFNGTRKNYEEFVVYDRNQCYPEFVVEYERC